MLNDLSDEHREFILRVRAENRSITETWKIFYETYPDAEETRQYSKRAFEEWFKKPQIKEDLMRAQRSVIDGTRSYSYANKDNRLLALIEISEKMMEELRILGAGDKLFPVINRELRENFKFIKDEVDPFNMEDEQVRSAYETFMERAKGTPFEQFFKTQDSIQATQQS